MPFRESIPSRTGAFPLGSEGINGRQQTVFGVLYEDRYSRDGALFFLMTGHRDLVEALVGRIPRESHGNNGDRTKKVRPPVNGHDLRRQGFYHGKSIRPRPFRH